MKLRYIIILLILGCCLCGCEYYFPLEGLDRDSKLYVQCIAGSSDRTFINIQKAMGVNATAGGIMPEVEKISLKVNGKECAVEKFILPEITQESYYDPEVGYVFVADDYDPDYYLLKRYNLWYTDTPIKDGDELSLEVSARGMETVTANSNVPEKVIIQEVKAAPRCTTITDFDYSYTESFMSFDIALANVSPEDYLGVKIVQHVDITYTYDDGNVECYTMDSNGSIITWSGSDDIMDEIQQFQGAWTPSLYNNYFIDNNYGYGMSLISGKDLKDGHLQFDCNIEFASDETSTTVYYDEETGSLVPNGTIGRKVDSKYKLEIYKVSPEFFRYNKAQYLLDGNYLAEVGLSPSTFSYTNMKGGFGLLGALTCTSTQWYQAPEDPDPREY